MTVNDQLLEVVWIQVIHLISVIIKSLAGQQATTNHTQQQQYCKVRAEIIIQFVIRDNL